MANIQNLIANPERTMVRRSQCSDRSAVLIPRIFSRFNFSKGHKPPMQQAQATFMVSMPTPNRRPGAPSKEIALGTALVPYVDDESDDEENSAIPQLLDAYPC